MPTYIKVGSIRSDGPGCGRALPGPERVAGRQNMNLSVDGQRFGTRRTLLNDLDSINRRSIAPARWRPRRL